MARIMQDPLLTFSRILLIVLMGLLAFAALMTTIGLGAALTVARSDVLEKVAEAGAPASAYWIAIVLLVLLIGVICLGLRFLYELRSIVLSVGEGDPFKLENASRLSRMGWLTLAAQLLIIPMSSIGIYLSQLEGDGQDIDIDFGVGGGGILLILVLFVLARVFRKGAEMREELEGTI